MRYANNNIGYEIKCARDVINVLVNISSSRSDRYLKFTSMHKVSNLQRRIHFTSTLFFAGTFSLAEKHVHISLLVSLFLPFLSRFLSFSHTKRGKRDLNLYAVRQVARIISRNYSGKRTFSLGCDVNSFF